MNESDKQELETLIQKYSKNEGANDTPIPGVYAIRMSRTERILPRIYEPSLCIIVQGKKHAMLGDELYRYEPADYLIVSVDLPMIGRVIEASSDRPYLCIKIKLDLQLISELVLQLNLTSGLDEANSRGIFVGKLDGTISESVLRLARLMECPADIPFLAPSMIREIYYRLLRSKHGELVAQTALNGTNMQRIANVLQKIKNDLTRPLAIKDLAQIAGMSVSTFHVHFKTVTAMSPLQYQKRLRLIEARQIMLTSAIDVADTAYRVGYESPSQFNREYARMFGNSPGRDINHLKKQIEFGGQDSNVQ